MNENDIVQMFSSRMNEKIEIRRNRYVPFAWKTMDIRRLIQLLEGELKELKEEYDKEVVNGLRVAEEAVDVANYAMFIWELSKNGKRT